MSLYRFSKREIPLFFKQAQRILRHKVMDVLAMPKAQEKARLLVVIPKRSIRRAVDRNRIRRRLKHIFYEEKLFTSSSDYIIVVKEPALHAPFQQLKNLFCQTVDRHEATPHS